MGNCLITSTLQNGIILLTLNRPDVANSLSMQLLEELRAALQVCKGNQSIRCVIITGAGENVFCAGADLKERSKMNDNQVRKAVSFIRETMNEIEALPQPVLAAVNGVALGGGTELALACDIRIASETATFGLTETALGIIPGAGGTQRLPRLIGKGRAKELIFTARRIDAAEAKEIGLVEFVEQKESVLNQAVVIAKAIARNGPIAVAQAKLAINRGCDTDLDAGLSIETHAYEITIPTKDRLEGLKAFQEKRTPRFQGE